MGAACLQLPYDGAPVQGARCAAGALVRKD